MSCLAPGPVRIAAVGPIFDAAAPVVDPAALPADVLLVFAIAVVVLCSRCFVVTDFGFCARDIKYRAFRG
eukprot:scaffold384878_cov28-Attheya_sp.AAC.1